ncbi:hypothetical protein [Desulfitobacterium sp. AusDCA]|uniref:hypothetical protein n=1 Tax=Desulfitobacterium sp. AusDCA TaxID=3240383 RepID=UPI003DA7892B
MTIGSILTGLILTEIVVAFALFAAYFINKQTSSVGFTSRFNQLIIHELQPILGTLFVLTTLIVLAVICYSGITYTLKG